MKPLLTIAPELAPCPTLPALVWAEDVDLRDPPPMPEYWAKAVNTIQSSGSEMPAELKKRVRQMLRHGRYKPNGRAKPASEFLFNAARSGALRPINPAVDINNTISLLSCFPASIFDADLCGHELLLRRGLAGERYTFNSAGQSIDLEDLLLVCRQGEDGWLPCGNPVKDSMDTKIAEKTTNIIALLYAPADEPPESVTHWAQRFEALLAEHCRAAQTGVQVVPCVTT